MGGFSFRGIFLCLLCILCHERSSFLVLSAKVVHHLPGFKGPLPFYLETGYVTVDEINGGELFYYFIKSEGKPSKDPLLLWLTGARCSALSGLIFEIGPFKIVKAVYKGSIPEIEYHPYAWTQFANIIFLDSPLGAGFSFSSNPNAYEVSDSLASSQIQKFLMKWYVDHPEYISHPFYMAGDSSAGKIVPVVAQLISQSNEAGQEPIVNLKGYLVGNPSTGEKIDYNSRVPYAHGVGIISDQIFEMLQKSCDGDYYFDPTNLLCAEIMNIFHALESEVSTAHILEPHCIFASPTPKFEFENRRFLIDESDQLLSKPAAPPFYCREYSFYLSYFWANDMATRHALGVKKGTVNEWQRCVSIQYKEDIKSSIKYHLNLTTRGYRALVYSGDHDMVLPFVGTQTWVRSLNFSVVDGWRAWHADGQTAGFTEKYSNDLTFATVRGAGHTAPEYKPKECLAMFQRWISYQPL